MNNPPLVNATNSHNPGPVFSSTVDPATLAGTKNVGMHGGGGGVAYGFAPDIAGPDGQGLNYNDAKYAFAQGTYPVMDKVMQHGGWSYCKDEKEIKNKAFALIKNTHGTVANYMAFLEKAPGKKEKSGNYTFYIVDIKRKKVNLYLEYDKLGCNKRVLLYTVTYIKPKSSSVHSVRMHKGKKHRSKVNRRVGGGGASSKRGRRSMSRLLKKTKSKSKSNCNVIILGGRRSTRRRQRGGSGMTGDGFVNGWGSANGGAINEGSVGYSVGGVVSPAQSALANPAPIQKF